MMLPADLPQLPGVQRRCLRVLSEFPDLAHGARRLHWSQAILREVISDLMARLGARHIHVDGDRVQMSETLKSVVEHQLRLCGPVNEGSCPASTRPGEPELPGLRSAHTPQITG